MSNRAKNMYRFFCQVSRPLLAIACIFILTVSYIFAQDDLVAIRIIGTIRTEEGQPVSGSSLQLTYVSVSFDEEGTPKPSDGRVVVQSDTAGRYEFQMNIDPDWSDFVLAVNSLNLDTFRYKVPGEKNLTDIIRNAISAGEFEVEVNWIVSNRPNWQLELGEIEKYGIDSEKSRLIRVRGLPERILSFRRKDGQVGEIWYYYSAGIAVRFVGDRRDKNFYFKPVQPR
jgi:hypothetical protein